MPRRTTLGQLLVNDALPADLRDDTRLLGKDEADQLLAEVAHRYPDQYRDVSHKLAVLGGEAAYTEGSTLGLSDLKPVMDKKELLDHVAKQERRIKADKTLSDDDKQEALAGVYQQVEKLFQDQTLVAGTASRNPFAQQVKSKARGNKMQLVAMLTTPGSYTDSKGNVIPSFIRHSFAEGLDPHEYWAGTYGARASILSTKFCLAADTLVLTPSGSVPISELSVGASLYSVNDQQECVPTRISAITAVGVKDCAVYHFGEGNSKQTISITATPEHKVLQQYRVRSTGEVRRVLRPLGDMTMGRRSLVRAAGFESSIGIPESRALLAKSRRREANHGARFRRTVSAGPQLVYDIEVEHPSHQFVLANGAIVANSTRQAGYLGKQFNNASIAQLVAADDCGTHGGIPVPTSDQDSVGALLARDAGPYEAGTALTSKILKDLSGKKIDDIVVRSPLTCSLPEGLCKLCVGQREDGKLPTLGTNIGLNATSALAERIAQQALSLKHTSGKKEKGDAEYVGFDVINNLAQIPGNFPDRATVARQDGTVTAIAPAPQGGTNVMINDETHHVLQGHPVHVKEGDVVEQGDQLSGGIVNPAEVVQYKGLGEGRRYFADRFTKAFQHSGYGVNRRNVEVLTRSMMNHVNIDEPEGLGDYLPGDVARYSAVQASYKPRPDATRQELSRAKGQYLEEPLLHYTVGTRVTNGVTKDLARFGIKSGLTHPRQVGFTPEMVSLVKVPEHEPDWMVQLGSNYLNRRLLESVHRGAESDVHGMNPIPAIARGTELGNSKPGKITY